jgi:hypothetical protein
MAMIYARARQGRRAFFEGRMIPEDKFVPLPDTPYIRRLVHHWGDLEVEGGGEPPEAEAKTQAPRRRQTNPRQEEHKE